MKYSNIALILIIGLSPLSRATEIFTLAYTGILVIFFSLYYYRVQSLFRIAILIFGILVASSILSGIYPTNKTALLYYILAACIGVAVWIIRSTDLIPRSIFIAILIGCIGIYAQWGIAQFIVQHDLGMHVIGESRISPGMSGVASFTSSYGRKFIRAYGPFAHSNTLGGVLVLGLILVTSLRTSYKPYTTPIIFVLILGVIASFSRTALIASLVPLMILMFRSRQYTLALVTITPLLLFTPLLMGRLLDPNGVALPDRAQGFAWLAEMATPESILRGYGMGNYETALVSHFKNTNTPHNVWDIAPVHSVPLLLFSELGGVISIALLAIVSIFFFSHRSFMLLALLPPLLLDHYFLTQLGALIFLITCTLLVVQYRSEHSTY